MLHREHNDRRRPFEFTLNDNLKEFLMVGCELRWPQMQNARQLRAGRLRVVDLSLDRSFSVELGEFFGEQRL